MNPLDDLILNALLRTGPQGVVSQKEDDRIEFKEIFDNSSKEAKAKYAKEMAALCNYQGGYLIFGVDDKQNLIGLKNFSEPDNALLADDINTYFSPAIRFASKAIVIEGRQLFVVHVAKRASIPTVCVKGFQEDLKVSTIYWRYAAQSSPIKPGDLIDLLNSLRGESNNELTEITKREFRAKYKPRLQTLGSTSGLEFGIRIENKGEDAIVQGFEIIDSNIDLAKISLYRWPGPVTILKHNQIKITGSSPEAAQNLKFTLLLKYTDV